MSQRMSRGLQRGPISLPRQGPKTRPEPMHPVAAAPAVSFKRTNERMFDGTTFSAPCVYVRPAVTRLQNGCLFFGAPKT